MSPTFRDVAEGGTWGFVIAAAAWGTNFLRRIAVDSESRAHRNLAEIEADLAEMKTELEQCHAEHHAKDRLLARMERALILADIPIPE